MKYLKIFFTFSICFTLLFCSNRENRSDSQGQNELENVKLPYSVSVIGKVINSLEPSDTSTTELLLRVEDFKDSTILRFNPLNIKVIDKEKKEYLSTSFCFYNSNEISFQGTGGMFTEITRISKRGYKTCHYNFADSIGIDVIANSNSKMYLGFCFDVVLKDIDYLDWFDNSIKTDSAYVKVYESDYLGENFKY